MSNIRHLHHHRSLANAPSPHQSLDFLLMRAVRMFDNGNWMGGVEALCEAIELQHNGGHEAVSSDRLNQHLRSILGTGWTPKGAA